jgi:hypothetical protein
MQYEIKPTTMIVASKTFGNLRTSIWARLKQNGRYRFIVKTVKAIPSDTGLPSWSQDYAPEDAPNLEQTAHFVFDWFCNSEVFRALADKDQLEEYFPFGF